MLLLFNLNIRHSIKWLKFLLLTIISQKTILSLSIHSLAEMSPHYNMRSLSLPLSLSNHWEGAQVIVVPARFHSHYPFVTHSAGSSQTPSGNPGAAQSHRGWTHQRSCCPLRLLLHHHHRTGTAGTRHPHHQALASPFLQCRIIIRWINWKVRAN